MPGPFTLGQIASQLGGRVAGDPGVLIRQVGSLEGAAAGQIGFLSSARHRSQLAATHASAVVLAPETESLTALPRIVAPDPYAYFARVSQLFNPLVSQPPGVHPSASVAPGAKLGARVSIGAGCAVAGGVEIGDDSCLYPGVVVYPGCRIGARSIIHAGTVIGADGFGIAREEGRWIKIPQIGAVRIGDDVEIGANCCIDRGTFEDTVLGDGVKLDNQIQIGHNCRIGAHTAIAGCTGIGGSAIIGANCTIGGAAMIQGHLEICDGTHISGATMVSRSIREPGTYTGIFPMDEHRAWKRNGAALRNLAELAGRVRELEKQLAPRKEKGGKDV